MTKFKWSDALINISQITLTFLEHTEFIAYSIKTYAHYQDHSGIVY